MPKWWPHSQIAAAATAAGIIQQANSSHDPGLAVLTTPGGPDTLSLF